MEDCFEAGVSHAVSAKAVGGCRGSGWLHQAVGLALRTATTHHTHGEGGGVDWGRISLLVIGVMVRDMPSWGPSA